MSALGAEKPPVVPQKDDQTVVLQIGGDVVVVVSWRVTLSRVSLPSIFLGAPPIHQSPPVGHNRSEEAEFASDLFTEERGQGTALRAEVVHPLWI